MFASIAQFLLAIGTAVAARKGGDTADLVEIINLGAKLLEVGTEGRIALEALTQKVQRMVQEGRDPTEAEMADVKALRDLLHTRIQSVVIE